MATTTKVLYNDFIAIERDLNSVIPCSDEDVFSGTVVAVSVFVNQISVDDFVLYKRLYTYSEDSNEFDVAKESETILRNPIIVLP